MFATSKKLANIHPIYIMHLVDAGVYLHDPTTLLAAVNPSLLTYTEGVVRVQTTGIMRGLTMFHNSNKRLENFI